MPPRPRRPAHAAALPDPFAVEPPLPRLALEDEALDLGRDVRVDREQRALLRAGDAVVLGGGVCVAAAADLGLLGAGEEMLDARGLSVARDELAHDPAGHRRRA